MLDVKKILKAAIKRKIRITEALVVSFLITGNISYALDISNDLVNDSLISNANLTTQDLNINNEGVISSYYNYSSNSTYNMGNGILNGDVSTTLIPGDSRTIKSVTNNGVISGYYKNLDGLEKSSVNYGNGILSYSGVLNNNIYTNNTSSIGPINNTGIISGFNNHNNSKSIEAVSGVSYSGNGIASLSSKSSIGDIINTGIISGFNINESYLGASASGNAIISTSLYFGSSTIGEINNKGVISGYNRVTSEVYDSGGWSHTSLSGNGIVSIAGGTNTYSGFIGNVNNTGIISGINENFSNALALSDGGSGNGILISNRSAYLGGNDIKYHKDINNNGVISGYSRYLNENRSGNAIMGDDDNQKASLIKNIVNNGLVKGSRYAIFGNFVSATNNGIMAGRYIDFSGDTNPGTISNGKIITNKGIQIILVETNPMIIKEIKNGTGGTTVIDGVNKTIVNANAPALAKDSSITSTELAANKDLIINGAGISKGALVVNSEFALDDSIVNGYNSALYIENGSKLVATNSTFNGGGIKGDIAVIRGSEEINTLEILGNSVINGDVDLAAGNDSLTISNDVQINGSLNGGIGTDSLTLGTTSIAKNSTNLNLIHDISGFESIETNGDVTLFETIKITDANNINIASGNLTLHIDPTVKDENGVIIGHAFYQKPIATFSLLNEPMAIAELPTITSTGGYLVLGLNGLGENSLISMGGYTLTPDIDDSWWKPSDYLITDSLVLDAKLQADGNVLITVKESIPLEPPITPEDPNPPVQSIDPGLYEDLNQVYQSIVTAGEIGVLANTTLLEGKTYEEALGGLLTILDQIYANNPYAYSLKSSRDSLKLFEDNLSYLTIKPKENEWIVQGKGFYSGVKNDNSDSGKGYYGFDTSHRNYKTTTSFGGGLATAEYGLTNDSSVGFVFGGGHQNTNFKGSSKIKGNTLYLGAFAKKEINQFKLISGIGYQYGSLKGERAVSNLYNSFKTDDTYDVNSFNAFVEAKYDYALNNDWTLSPKAKLSWYYVSQDSVNEGYDPGNLSLKVDSAKGNTGDLEIGLDLKNTLALNSGNLSNILSVGVINTIGDREKDLTGNILGAQGAGSDFDIQGIKLPRTSGKLSYNLEYEKTNGMIYTLGLGYEFAKDNNKNVTGTLGLGYKF